MPVAGLFPRFISRCGEANHLGVELVVNHSSTLFVGCRDEPAEVVSPSIHWAHLGNAVVTHGIQASWLEAE